VRRITECKRAAPSRKPHAEGPAGAQDAAAGEQTIEYGVPAQAVVRRQLSDYEREGGARRFFENWRASLKWQRLKRYEKFSKI